jgi:hypothetical protein
MDLYSSTREQLQAFYDLMDEAIPQKEFPGSDGDQSRAWGATEVLTVLCDPSRTPNGDLILDEIRRLRSQP